MLEKPDNFPVIIDRRPIFMIIAEKLFIPVLYIILLTIFIAFVYGKNFEGLENVGKNTLIIFFLCVTLWIGQVIPIGVTGLLAIVLLPLLGVMRTEDAYSLFGNNAVFFLIGVFILGAAIKISGLATRIALLIFQKFGKTPKNLIMSLYFLTFFMSWFIPEHVVAAIAFPIVLEIARSLNLSFKNKYGKLLFLSLSWGCITGGVATFLGGARVPLAVDLLQKTTGKTITFLNYMMFGIPVSVILGLLGFLILSLFFPYGEVDLNLGRNTIQKMIRNYGLITYREQLIAMISVITISLWIFKGQDYGLANIAIVSISTLFLLRLLKWHDVQDNVNWGIILMYGGAISLGSALEKTGASRFIAQNFFFTNISDSYLVIIILSILTITLTAVMSNAATVAALLPIAIAIGNTVNIDARFVTLTVAFISGLDFVLPIGTPASAIAYSSGYLRIPEMFVPGIIMSALAIAVFFVFYKLYLPLIW